ncbi:MAG: site-specific integrase, partial [Rikenellaceae bacterium]
QVMASVIIQVKTTSTDPDAMVNIKMRVNAYYGKKLSSAYASTGVSIPNKVWDKTKKSVKALYLKGEINEVYRRAKENLDKIVEHVNATLNTLTLSDGKSLSIEISSEWLKSVIQEYWDEVKAIKDEVKAKRKEEAEKVTLSIFIKRYIKEIEEGGRLTDKGLRYSAGTIKSIRTSMVQFAEFQKWQRKKIDFDDVDTNFYKKYTSWLTTVKGYKPNSVGKCIKDLKSVLNKAKDEGLHSNTKHQNKSFKVTTEEVENIYLTQVELEAMEALDLGRMADGYEIARDIFLLGCCLAQRVSDYSAIKESDISTSVVRKIASDGSIEEREALQVTIVQQKGGDKVIIPLNAMAKRILAKYHNTLPNIAPQKINQYIKDVGRKAGITDVVEINSIEGGVKKCETFEKCDLIVSHTARRTGATLMYLSGMDLYDICKITGHTNIKTLRKYIKADELDVVSKIIGYNYFN